MGNLDGKLVKMVWTVVSSCHHGAFDRQCDILWCAMKHTQQMENDDAQRAAAHRERYARLMGGSGAGTGSGSKRKVWDGFGAPAAEHGTAGNVFTSPHRDECRAVETANEGQKRQGDERLDSATHAGVTGMPQGPMTLAFPSTHVQYRTVGELLRYRPPADLNLAGDLHLQRGGTMLLAGAPGTGKSRALVALALAGAMGKGATWFGLPVHRRFRTLILQCENGPERLRGEWLDIVAEQQAARKRAMAEARTKAAATPMMTDPLAASVLEEKGRQTQHTRTGSDEEVDLSDPTVLDAWVRISLPPTDGFRLQHKGLVEELRCLIREFQPHMIGIDPWVSMAESATMSNSRRALELLNAALPAGANRPALVIVAHTRRPRSDERRSQRGLLHEVAGSTLLTATARSVFVLQHATECVDEKRVVMTCCKNNDGELGARGVWLRKNGLFAPCTNEFDWEGFDRDSRLWRQRKMLAAHVRAVHEGAARDGLSLTMAEAVRRLVELSGVSRATAYRVLKESET